MPQLFIEQPAPLNAPHDPRLAPIWSTAISWALRSGGQATDQYVRPIFDRLLPLFLGPDGRIDATRRPFPSPSWLPYEYPEVPGLVMRLATPGDVAGVVNVLVQRGNFTRHRATLLITDAVSHPMMWAFMWEWRGQPLQFESLHVGGKDLVSLGFTVHFTRERPHWFWRECERPVYRALGGAGYRTVLSYLRKDRAYWLPAIRENYGVAEVKEHQNTLRIEFAVDHSIFQGWPERRTAGPDWTFTHGNLRFREATEADLPAIRNAIRSEHRNPTQRGICLDLLEPWWHLDRAAILLGFDGDRLRYMRAARLRRRDNCNVAQMHPGSRDDGYIVSALVYLGWLVALGYTTATTFIPESIHAHPLAVPNYAREHWRMVKKHDQFKQPFYEYECDLSAFSQRSLADWLAEVN